MDWLANYVLVLVYPVASAAFGLPWVMVIFAVLCVFGDRLHQPLPAGDQGLGAEEVIKLFDGPLERTRPCDAEVVRSRPASTGSDARVL